MSDLGLDIGGGAGGVAARFDDLEALGALADDLALAMGGIAAQCHQALADPDVAASAALDPWGAASFEKKLLLALDGPDGLTALALGFGEQAIRLRATAGSYRIVDEARAESLDALRWLAGYGLGAVVEAGLVGVGLLALTDPVGVVLVAGAAYLGLGCSPLSGSDIQQLVLDHPGVVDDLVGASPGLISNLTGHWVGLQGAADMIGSLYPDGVAVGRDLGVDDDYDAGHGAPTDFADLMAGLSHRDGSAHDDGHDMIDVRAITQPDGRRSYIVDIPGTKTWDAPGPNAALDDLGTDIHGIAGDPTARESAVADALRRAGVSPADPVMLVGHSQGGLVAAQAAHDTTTGSFHFNVTHVFAVGSPVARVDIPPGIQMLSLENRFDVVPRLDAAANPDRPNVTTATFDLQRDDIGMNHAIGSAYTPGAAALDRSADPSVLAFRDSAGAFLGAAPGSAVRTYVYDYHREVSRPT